MKLKAILIDIIHPSIKKEEANLRLKEAENLIETFGGIVLMKKIQKKMIPDYSTFIGKGKLQEIIEESKNLNANIIIINNELKPRQTFKISELIQKNNLQIWDRIDLILKIFAKHATTKEAKLEIQLAGIKHMGPRIFGMGMELSQQGGGIGTKGVGETNIEFMKRHLQKMEKSIINQLEKFKKVLKLHRQSREKKQMTTIGIIGYTNVGKSSLLNALTKKNAYQADKLFATLDTRIGKMILPHTHHNHHQHQLPRLYQSPHKPNDSQHPHEPYGPNELQQPHKVQEPHNQFTNQNILISDTIGFIRDLPPELIKSFHSTLEETIKSDILIHTIDCSDQEIDNKIKIVNKVLAQIEALHKPIIYVFNKVDKVPTILLDNIKTKYNFLNPIFISATKKIGILKLKNKIINLNNNSNKTKSPIP